jgi:hypothetical protein
MIEDNLKEIISRRKQSFIDKIPEGWITVKDACKILGLSDCRVRTYLQGAAQAGEVQTKSFRIVSGSAVRPVPHYFVGKKLK